jgi:hypothetical protein
MSEPFSPPSSPDVFALQSTQIAVQPPAADPLNAAVPPNSVACSLRRVGTFGLPGDAAGTDRLELKANGTRAQGAGGYNPPSLYGLSVGAPYLHHGQATTLAEVFTDGRWQAHLRAGNPEYSPSPEDVGNLVAFLLSIDATKQEIPSTQGSDACLLTFPAGATAVVDLTPDQEVPPLSSDQSGDAFVALSGDERTLFIELGVQNISRQDLLAAHVHVAPAGENGDVAMFIARAGFTSPVRVTLDEGDFLPIPAAPTFAEFIQKLRQGGTYINVHTVQNMGGAVRGQIPSLE